ncbi:MAG TPA: hypothetical protein VH477_18080 [Bryobacteraceae bacterium]
MRSWQFARLSAHPVPRRVDVPISLTNVADKDYFQPMRIPLKAGRVFSEAS